MAAYSMAAAAHTLIRSLLLRPLRLPAIASFSLLRHHNHHSKKLSFSLLPSHSFSFSSSSTLSIPQCQSLLQSGVEQVEAEVELNEAEEKQNEEIEKEDERQSEGSEIPAAWSGKEREVPNLTVKEKKELGSYANSLGDKLKSQQVGKSGVTDNVVLALDETLEKNELLKLKIHKSCPGELEDVVRLIERATGSAAVFQIGRIVIFYRPSITKMKKEEKKAQARKIFEQRRKKAQAAFMIRRKEQTRGSGTTRRFERASS